jgi:hypothetical protein
MNDACVKSDAMGKTPKTGQRILTVILGLCMLSACATTQRKTAAQSPLVVVEQYLSALNRRDMLALTAYVAPDVAWFSLVNGERLQEVDGRDALIQTLRTYFAQNQKTTWQIEQSIVVDQKVVLRERSQWRADEGSGERVSLVVYELSDGRIARISYFLGGR